MRKCPSTTKCVQGSVVVENNALGCKGSSDPLCAGKSDEMLITGGGGRRAPSGTASIFNGKSIKLENGFYSVDGMKISQSYYDRLWSQGRPAPFAQAQEILKSNPIVTPDPRGAPEYFRYESSGLEMIYNPPNGQIGHIQPIKIK